MSASDCDQPENPASPVPGEFDVDADFSILAQLKRREAGFPSRKANTGRGTDFRGFHVPSTFRRSLGGNHSFVRRLSLTKVFRGHAGCVNSVNWNSTGNLFVSGSDDCRIKVFDAVNRSTRLSFESGHSGNIFSVHFLPFSFDELIISCAADRQVRFSNTVKQTVKSFHCHSGRVKKLQPECDNPNVFISCSEDGTVRQFDLREPHRCARGPRGESQCANVLIDLYNHKAGVEHSSGSGVYRTISLRTLEINSVSLCPRTNMKIAIGGSGALVREYDRRMLSMGIARSGHHATPIQCYAPRVVDGVSNRLQITGVHYNKSGTEILASYSEQFVYLFDVCRRGLARDVRGGSQESLSATEDDGVHFPEKKRKRGGKSTSAKRFAHEFETFFEKEKESQSEFAPSSGGGGRPIHATVMHVHEGKKKEEKARRKAEKQAQKAQKAEEKKDRAEKEKKKKEDKRKKKKKLEEPVEAEDVEEGLEKGDQVGDDNEDESDLSSPRVTSPHVHFYEYDSEDEVRDPELESERCIFKGHRNVYTIKEINYFGPNDEYVVSGSDDGRVFIWDKFSTDIIQVLKGDEDVVNVCKGHPFNPWLLSSGIENDIKFWQPTAKSRTLSAEMIEEIVRMNKEEMTSSFPDEGFLDLVGQLATGSTMDPLESPLTCRMQ